MRNTLLLLFFATFMQVPPAGARTFSIPQKQAAAGSEVVFPIYLDDASGAASIQLQLNFDAGILAYQDFETGSGLGAQFAPTAFAENGVLTLIWTRTTSLVSGTGCLGLIKFQVNPGAENGLICPLTISNHETTDESGVAEFSMSEAITAVSGSLTVSTGGSDADNDGIPDDWETSHTLNPLVSNANADTDHDGRSDFLEYALGGNPLISDPDRSPVASHVADSGADYLTLSFSRRNDANLLYRVWESPTLGTWAEIPIESRLLGIPEDQGDGTERITVRSTFQMRGPDASPLGFMKVEVEKP